MALIESDPYPAYPDFWNNPNNPRDFDGSALLWVSRSTSTMQRMIAGIGMSNKLPPGTEWSIIHLVGRLDGITSYTKVSISI